MSCAFDKSYGLIVVPVEVAGPTARAILRLALDTGATSTLVNTWLLVALGFDPGLSPDRVEVTTGSGVEFAARVTARKLNALGLSKSDFPVLAHTLPPTAGVDGVLGLDFLRGRVLTINFQTGTLAE